MLSLPLRTPILYLEGKQHPYLQCPKRRRSLYAHSRPGSQRDWKQKNPSKASMCLINHFSWKPPLAMRVPGPLALTSLPPRVFLGNLVHFCGWNKLASQFCFHALPLTSPSGTEVQSGINHGLGSGMGFPITQWPSSSPTVGYLIHIHQRWWQGTRHPNVSPERGKTALWDSDCIEAGCLPSLLSSNLALWWSLLIWCFPQSPLDRLHSALWTHE